MPKSNKSRSKACVSQSICGWHARHKASNSFNVSSVRITCSSSYKPPVSFNCCSASACASRSSVSNSRISSQEVRNRLGFAFFLKLSQHELSGGIWLLFIAPKRLFVCSSPYPVRFVFMCVWVCVLSLLRENNRSARGVYARVQPPRRLTTRRRDRLRFLVGVFLSGCFSKNKERLVQHQLPLSLWSENNRSARGFTPECNRRGG